jgi:hypothetical protein
MVPIDFGGGMIFPSRYDRDQFSPREEAEWEARQAMLEEQAAEDEWLLELPEAHGVC